MVRLYLQACLVLALVVALHALVGAVPSNKVDAYYRTFTRPPTPSLVLGNSRAAQGIDPSAFDEVFRVNGLEGPMFNFALTNSTSPYGPTYERALDAKLLPGQGRALHVVTVDPWALSRHHDNAFDDPQEFEELENFLATTSCLTCRPNYEYLLEQFDHGWGRLLFARPRWFVHHDNGWLELTIPQDEASRARRTRSRIKAYRENVLPNKRPSRERRRSLRRILKRLKATGDVFLIRLPTSGAMLAIESELSPTFDSDMKALGDEHDIPYWSWASAHERFLYTDGNHLAAESSRAFSEELAARVQRALQAR